jgi:DNA-binding GntR family transcriptional regulator
MCFVYMIGGYAVKEQVPLDLSQSLLYTIFMSLKEKIIREVRDAIVQREYAPGEHLTEIALCERFHVSRTPVREALNQLEKEGLIKIIQSVGAKVVRLSLEETLMIYDLLIILEGASSRLACPKITDDQLGKLEEYNFLFEKAMDEKNAELLFELNSHFHWLITEATKNTYLIEMRANFRLLVDRIARIFPTIPGQAQATLVEHKQVITTLKSRNPALAEFRMREHLEGAKRKLEEYLREKEREWEA